MQTHIILVRHGQTQANVNKLWHGSTDTPLNEIGHLQAGKAAQRLASEHPDTAAVFSSPLQRTQDTATAIAEALQLKPIKILDNLQEYGIGSLEGSSFSSLEKTHNFFANIRADRHYTPEGGESLHQVASRMVASIDHIKQQYQGKKVIAVSHGAAMALALASIIDNDIYAWGKYVFQNTSITELVYKDSPALIRLNCSEHLQTD